LDILEQDGAEEVLGIYTTPPVVSFESDKDSGDEDGNGFIDNLHRNQLTAVAEAVLPSGRLEENELEDGENSQPSTHPTSSQPQTSTMNKTTIKNAIKRKTKANKTKEKRKRRKIPQKSRLRYKWSKTVKPQLPRKNLNETATFRDFTGKSPVEIFEFSFDNECMNYIVEETNRYVCQKEVEFHVTVQDMKIFF